MIPKCAGVLEAIRAAVAVSSVVLLVAACSVSLPPDRDAGTDAPRFRVDDIEASVHFLINTERERAGRRHLVADSALADVARLHSRDMAIRDYFDHRDPVHGSPTDRAAARGYVCEKREGDMIYSGIAENIAMQHTFTRFTDSVRNGQRTRQYEWSSSEEIAMAVVQGWMNSPGHRANLLDGRADRHGIGVHIHNQRVYVTQNIC